MSGQGYVYDQGWQEERTRIGGMEALWDPGTQALLEPLVQPGARCLCVGAGGGSIAEWLVGRGAQVLATDIDTRFIEPLASETLEVQRLDVVTDEIPAGAFDLIHGRLLIEHLPQRDVALDKLAAALKPGGHLVIEDYDWASFGFDNADEVDARGVDGIIGFMERAGFDRAYGRRVVGDLAARGLSVRGEGRCLVIDPDHPGSKFFQLSFEQLAPAAVQAGTLDTADAEVLRGRLYEPGRRFITPTLVAAIGQSLES